MPIAQRQDRKASFLEALTSPQEVPVHCTVYSNNKEKANVKILVFPSSVVETINGRAWIHIVYVTEELDYT